VPARAEAEVLLAVTDAKQKEVLTSNLESIKRLANANPVNIGGPEIKPTGKAASEVISETTVFIPLDKLIDVEKSREKLVQRLTAKEKDRDKVKGQLSNESFISRAPKEKVDEQKALLADVENQIASINAQLDILKSN
jgi:valyl-tRNA synthetase